MKMKAFGMDANKRSAWAEVDIPFKSVTPLHAETEQQDGAYWGISINQPGEPVGGGVVRVRQRDDVLDDDRVSYDGAPR